MYYILRIHLRIMNYSKTVKKIVENSIKLKIPIVTFYVFSTENWKRPKSEINFLFQLIINYFKEELNRVILNGIKINILGKLNRLPSKIKTALKDVSKKNKKKQKNNCQFSNKLRIKR